MSYKGFDIHTIPDPFGYWHACVSSGNFSDTTLPVSRRFEWEAYGDAERRIDEVIASAESVDESMEEVWQNSTEGLVAYEKYEGPALIDRGHGYYESVKWRAYLKDKPAHSGYGHSDEEAYQDLLASSGYARELLYPAQDREMKAQNRQ